MAPDPLDRLLALVERIKPIGPQDRIIAEMKDCVARMKLGQQHYTRREGDEWACSCGARWHYDEDHP